MRAVFAVAIVMILLIVAAAASQAHAQEDYFIYFHGEQPAEFVPKAFAEPYGQAVLTQFANAVEATANSECLKSNGITKGQLAARARALPIRRGIFIVQHFDVLVDWPTFKTYLAAKIGREGATEFERLRQDPIVQVYRAVERPYQDVAVVDHVMGYIWRFMTIDRIKLAKPFSPIEDNIKAIVEVDPSDKVMAKLKDLIASDKSGALNRYVEMNDMARKPYRDAYDMDKARTFAVVDFLAGSGEDRESIRRDFINLCVAQPGTER